MLEIPRLHRCIVICACLRGQAPTGGLPSFHLGRQCRAAKKIVARKTLEAEAD
jgi:hypothetical protein